jgi:hypothetical protein
MCYPIHAFMGTKASETTCDCINKFDYQQEILILPTLDVHKHPIGTFPQHATKRYLSTACYQTLCLWPPFTVGRSTALQHHGKPQLRVTDGRHHWKFICSSSGRPRKWLLGSTASSSTRKSSLCVR